MEGPPRDVMSTSARLEEKCFEALGVQMDLNQPPHLLLFASRCLTSLPSLPSPPPIPPRPLRWSYSHACLSPHRQILLPSCRKSEEEISEGTTLTTPNDPVVIKGVPEPPPTTPPTPPTSLHLLALLPYLVLLNPAPVSVIAGKGRAKEMRFVFRVLFFPAQPSPLGSLREKKKKEDIIILSGCKKKKESACIHRVNFHLTGNPSENRK